MTRNFDVSSKLRQKLRSLLKDINVLLDNFDMKMATEGCKANIEARTNIVFISFRTIRHLIEQKGLYNDKYNCYSCYSKL